MAHQRAPYSRTDWIALACVGSIALGWFALDSLDTSVGRFSRGTRFYELFAVLRHPVVLLIGVGNSYTMEVLGFTVLCLAVLGGALLGARTPRGAGATAAVLPLAMMVLMGLALYRGGLRLDTSAAPDSLRGEMLLLAQNALQRAQDGFARHVAAGPGAYLSLLASLILAWRSLARPRTNPALPVNELPPA